MLDLNAAAPGSPSDGDRHANLVIAHPVARFGTSIPNLLSVVAGNAVFEVDPSTRVKLCDIRFPDSFLRQFEGPRFGVQGWRSLLGAHDRPIFFGVVKPNVGLAPAAFAGLAGAAWRGGLDIAKDDEMLGDPQYSRLHDRLAAVMPELRRAEAETGQQKLYLVNITGEVEDLLPRHDLVWEKAGASAAIMINTFAVGLPAGRYLAQHRRMPLVSHFAMMTPYVHLPFWGISTLAFVRLLRLSGFDAFIVPGAGSRMMVQHDELRACVQACLAPMGSLKPMLPVPGGSDWAGTLARAVEVAGSVDFGFIPGRGIFAHPNGPRDGARSVRQAWDAHQSGKSIQTWAENHVELATAIQAFGKDK